MQLARVIGQAVATVKHPSFRGWKLLLVQPLHEGRTPDGDPLLAIDAVGAGTGDLVMVTSDGASARGLVKERKSPVRWAVIGICDQ
ncbi:MAG: EutN/CcmL family microcompartment protein [Gemmataceae bacterium]